MLDTQFFMHCYVYVDFLKDLYACLRDAASLTKFIDITFIIKTDKNSQTLMRTLMFVFKNRIYGKKINPRIWQKLMINAHIRESSLLRFVFWIPSLIFSLTFDALIVRYLHFSGCWTKISFDFFKSWFCFC